MKKSELKASIKEEIIEILSEATPEEIEAQKELNAELEKTKELQDDLSEEYAADKFNVNVFGYQTKYYKVCPGAKSFMDKVVAGAYGDVDKEKAIRLAKLHDVLFLLELRSLKDPQYANDVIKEAEYIAKTIKNQVSSMGIPVADVSYVDNHVEIIKDAAIKAINLSDLMEDEEPTTSQLKGASKDSVATIANKLQQTTKEMKSTVNKWKRSEGEEKQKLRDKLLKLTNIKKELESML